MSGPIEMMDARTCVTCVHHRRSRAGADYCARVLERVNIVTGEPSLDRLCTFERSRPAFFGRECCDRSGKYWRTQKLPPKLNSPVGIR